MAKTSSNSPKYRDFFITINESAECYNDIEEIIKDLNVNVYALIVHDKDILEQTDKETGELVQIPKKVHKHLMLELKNPISFNSIHN